MSHALSHWLIKKTLSLWQLMTFSQTSLVKLEYTKSLDSMLLFTDHTLDPRRWTRWDAKWHTGALEHTEHHVQIHGRRHGIVSNLFRCLFSYRQQTFNRTHFFFFKRAKLLNGMWSFTEKVADCCLFLQWWIQTLRTKFRFILYIFCSLMKSCIVTLGGVAHA